MSAERNTRAYDLFKLIVAILLLIIFILLLLRPPQLTPQVAAESTLALATPSPTAAPQFTPTFTSPPPSETPASTATSPPQATPTSQVTATPEASATLPAEMTPTVAPSPTVETPAPTATSAGTVSTVACAGALPSRLNVGDTVRVVTSLNVRSEPGIGENLLFTNPTNTQLTVIGGPVCLEYQGSAYVWWQVQMADGESGWSAEATLNGSFYFLEPLP